MAIATLCVLHTDPAQAQTVSISSTALFVTEGRTANIAVTITPASASPLTIRYTLGTDATTDTADADSADYTASTSLPIAARASSGVIAIPITDDAVDEPSREVFTITLDQPGPAVGYTLGSLITATVTIVSNARADERETYYYSTYQGTARSNDYEGVEDEPTSVDSGRSSFAISIDAISDSQSEDDEDFHLYVTASDATHPNNRQGFTAE